MHGSRNRSVADIVLMTGNQTKHDNRKKRNSLMTLRNGGGGDNRHVTPTSNGSHPTMEGGR